MRLCNTYPPPPAQWSSLAIQTPATATGLVRPLRSEKQAAPRALSVVASEFAGKVPPTLRLMHRQTAGLDDSWCDLSGRGASVGQMTSL